jgi:hypothetical protein
MAVKFKSVFLYFHLRLLLSKLSLIFKFVTKMLNYFLTTCVAYAPSAILLDHVINV